MKIGSRKMVGFCLVALAGVSSGCGSKEDLGQSGRLVQGPVLNASVFADNVSGGVRYVQDAGEVSTITDAVTGEFTLTSVPAYNYVLVSRGGKDKLTGQNAIQMIAPAGAANITPLTTLVALDDTGTVKAKLQALMPTGAKYDADISITASSAVLLVAKSVETMVQSMTSAVNTSAGTSTISANQMASIQGQTMRAIAAAFANPAVTATTLSAPATLSTSLQTASADAATSINAGNSNISIPVATARAMAASSVTATAGALNIGATASTSAISGGETAVMTHQTAQAFVTAVTNTSATAATAITATTTPTSYTAPDVSVVIPAPVETTGTTGGTSGGTGAGF